MKNHEISKDFSKKIVKALNKKGIFIVGSTFVPGSDGSFANGERAYMLNDNGTGMTRLYLEVERMA